jgi:hypothetical protein
MEILISAFMQYRRQVTFLSLLSSSLGLALACGLTHEAVARTFVAQRMNQNQNQNLNLNQDDSDDPPLAPRRTARNRNSQDYSNLDSDSDSPRTSDRQDSQTAQDSDPPRKAPPKLFVPAFVTYWSHDALGYHPSIALTIENSSGANLLGEPIQLQAHFRLLSEGILTIYRWQTYFDTIGGQQQVNTEAHGKRPFELPLDPADWPLIECKILCKVGDSSSDDAQNLLVARVRSTALSDEDARTELNFLLGRARLNKAKLEQQKKKFQQDHPNAPIFNAASGITPAPVKKPTRPATNSSNHYGSLANGSVTGSTIGQHDQSRNDQPKTEPPKIEQPLVATAQTLGAPAAIVATVDQFFNRALPGLGEDFYQFEKNFGMPYRTDVKDKNWIWAAYRKHPAVRIMAGSKGRTGKSDVVVAAINQESLSDQQVLAFAKALSGRFKGEKSTDLDHSVRYTQDGRIELTVFTTQSYRAIYFKTLDPDTQEKLSLIAVSRVPGSLSELLKEEGHKTDLLKLTLRGLGEETNSGSGAGGTNSPSGGRTNSDDRD